MCVASQTGALAQTVADSDVDALFERLSDPTLERWQQVETQIWQHWAQSGSPTGDLLLDRAREALEAEAPEIAVEHLTALIGHAPEFAEAYNARATAFYQMQMFGPALADIETALALNPRHFGALTGLAQILEQLGQDRDALSAYRAVAAIHPHRPDVRDGIERLEQVLGDTAL
jgi:tetratricopeptide (TPR) repeat protein